MTIEHAEGCPELSQLPYMRGICTCDALTRANERIAELDGEFQRGVKEAFNFLKLRAANNYSGRPKMNERCQIENAALEEAAEEMLAYLSPEDHTAWRNLDEALQRADSLSAKLARMEEALKTLAAQDSGIVGSTAKADCMAAIALAALATEGE